MCATSIFARNSARTREERLPSFFSPAAHPLYWVYYSLLRKRSGRFQINQGHFTHTRPDCLFVSEQLWRASECLHPFFFSNRRNKKKKCHSSTFGCYINTLKKLSKPYRSTASIHTPSFLPPTLRCWTPRSYHETHILDSLGPRFGRSRTWPNHVKLCFRSNPDDCHRLYYLT